MRYLHPVGINEAFIASGTYVRKLNDAITADWLEEWSIHQQPDHAHVIRVDVTERSQQFSLIVEAWVTPPQEGGQIARLDISAFSDRKSPIRHVRATYSFTSNRVTISSTLDGEPHYAEQSLHDAAVPHVETAFFIGASAAKVFERSEPTAVMVIAADILSLGQEPQLERWSIATNEPACLEIGSRVYEARQIELIRDNRAQSPIFVDRHGILLKQPLNMAGAWLEIKDYARTRG